MVLKALRLWEQIRENVCLEELEKDGLCRGEQRGKKPDVPVEVLQDALGKQYRDFMRAYGVFDENERKRCLADLRNVAGILFLKLDGQFTCPSKETKE